MPTLGTYPAQWLEGAPCPNCAHHLAGPSCQGCGQRNERLRLPLGVFVRDVVELLLKVDTKAVRTLRAIVFPGELTREFLLGRRVRFLQPLTVFLLGTALLLAARGTVVVPHGGSFHVSLPLFPKVEQRLQRAHEERPERSDELRSLGVFAQGPIHRRRHARARVDARGSTRRALGLGGAGVVASRLRSGRRSARSVCLVARASVRRADLVFRVRPCGVRSNPPIDSLGKCLALGGGVDARVGREGRSLGDVGCIGASLLTVGNSPRRLS
jgi:Protein of unknown function (DUF3667)